MRSTTLMAATLLPFTLAACSGSPATLAPNTQKSGHFVYIDDVSASPATKNDPAVVAAVERRIGDDMKRNVQLGDTLTIYESGARSAERMVAQPPIITDYNLRIPAAHVQLMRQLHDIDAGFHAHGGDNATNLLLTLETIHPGCSSGRDVVTLITDGVEESERYSAAKALAAGQPIHLPPPSGKYLTGCRLEFLGFGLTDDGAGHEQLLPARQLATLRQGWLDYLMTAGVYPGDVEFVSAF